MTYPNDTATNGYPASTTAPYTNGHAQPMDGRPGEYSQTDHASSAQYPPQQADVKFNPPQTPASDYSLNPSSARSGSFPDYLQRAPYPDASQQQQPPPRYLPTSAPNGAPGNMAHSSSPSSLPPANDDGQMMNHQQHSIPRSVASNQDIPVDPNITNSSPTYPPTHHYPPQYHHDMNQYHTPPAQMYRPHPPEYGAPPYSAPPHGMPPQYGHVPTSVSTPPSMVSAGARPPGGGHALSTVYSFVPIPGTHQQKRPRRRYEEIERMYKCGWNGCEKAYGTLNHLNAHVTMQSHGQKRTPEEFKEIRKEWKARKKEDEHRRKTEEDQQRSAMQQQQQQQQQQQHQQQQHTEAQPTAAESNGHQQQQQPPQAAQYPQSRPHLPPLGYGPPSGSVATQYGQQNPQVESVSQYGGGQMPAGSYGGYPQSPYGPNGNQVYHSSYSPHHLQHRPRDANAHRADESAGHGASRPGAAPPVPPPPQ